MVVVRLAKSGAKKNPYYFITVADSRKPRDGGYIERLGFFNPSAKGSEERLRFNLDRFDHWVSQGAQASDKVSELVKDARLSPEDLQAKLDAKKAKRTQKKEVLAAQKVAELAAQAEVEAKEEAEATPEAEATEEAAPEAEATEEAAPEAEATEATEEAEETAPEAEATEEAAPEAEVAEATEEAAPEAEVAEATEEAEETAPEAEATEEALLKQK
jgi:small subunit ribosomal protein S16